MNVRGILICGLWLCAAIARADTHYVAQAGQTPSGTYTNWSSAASNIQAAIDVAEAATLDTVLVSNGVYTLTNQIVITNGITVQSCNGKTLTFINGNYPAYSNRCFYLSNTAAVVDGFTISNGCLNSDGWLGGGVALYAGTMRNCSINSNMLAGNAAGTGTSGIYVDSGGVLSNCLVVHNTSTGGVGGVRLAGGRMDGCAIVSNNAYCYGGIYMSDGTIINSTSAWNKTIGGTWYYGVGMYMSGGLVSNCLFRSNGGAASYAIVKQGGTLSDSVVKDKTHAENTGLCQTAGNVVNCTFTNLGMGMKVQTSGTVSNCTIINNSPYGGAYMIAGIMRNCLVTGNSAVPASGNASGVTLEGSAVLMENCTIVKNDAYNDKPGVRVRTTGGTIRNCIIYNNPTNWLNDDPATASYTNCCTTPTNDLPGSGNITNNPAFVNSGAGNYRLSANSPCINMGMNEAWMSGAVDWDGKRRVDQFSRRVDMGCYELMPRGTLFGFR